MAPDVSLLIAADKAEQTIGHGVESAVSQIGMSAEVLVVVDCSSDRRTIAAAIACDEGSVSAARLHGNHGPGGLRNAEPKRMRGRWIAILGCGDVVLSGWAFKKIRCRGAVCGRSCPSIGAQDWVKLKHYGAR
jgi:glycosyltransferase involved in cell wall biosynthesis